MPPESEIPRPAQAHEEAKDSLVHQALHSAAYAAIQQPITGLSQMVDKVAGTELEAQTLMMEAPKEAEFGTASWHAQTLGGAAGGLIPLLAVGKLVKGQMAAAESSTGIVTRRAAIGLTIKESAATGFIHDAFLRPTTEGGNFWTNRLSNGIGGSLTFTAMTASSLGLAGASGSGFAKALSLEKAFRNPVVSGLVSGVPGGLVSAEYDSLIHHGRVATGKELGQSVYSMSLIGGGFGAQHLVFGAKPKANIEFKLTAPQGVKDTQAVLPSERTAVTEPTAVETTGLNTVGDGARKPMLDMAQITALLSKIQTDDGFTPLGKPGRLGGRLFESENPFQHELHDPFRRDPYSYRERYESPAEKATKDIKYATAKVLLESLEQSRGAKDEGKAPVEIAEKPAVEAIATAVEAVTTAVPIAELKISLVEAQAIADLKARNHTDAQRLVEVLGERGPAEARVAKEIMRSTFNEFFPLSTTELNNQFQQAKLYLEAKEVLQRLEASEGKDASVAKVATAEQTTTAAETVELRSPISVAEAQAFRTLQAQSAITEQIALSMIFEKRGPVAKWMCDQMQRDYQNYLKSGGMPEGGSSPFYFSKSGVSAQPVNEGYLKGLAEQGKRYVAAENVFNEMYRVPKEKRTHDPANPVTLAEANALAAFASQGSRWQVQSMGDIICARGREATWIAQKIAGNLLKESSGSFNFALTWRDKGMSTVSPETLVDLNARAHEYVAATDVVAKVEKDLRTGTKTVSSKVPITVEEANAIRILRNESQEQSLHLVQLLAERGPVAEFIGRRLMRVSNEPITQDALVALMAESGPYVKAREVLSRVEKEHKTGTRRGTTPVTLEEANAIVALNKEPGNHENWLVTTLAQRGPCAEFIAKKIKQHEYGNSSYNSSPLDQPALDRLTEIGHRYEGAMNVLAEVSASGKSTKAEGTALNLTVTEADAVATLAKYSSREDAGKLVELLGERGERSRWVANFISENNHTFRDGVNAKALEVVDRTYEIQQVLDTKPAEVVNKYRLNAYGLSLNVGISGAAEAARYVDVITRMDPPADNRRWNQTPEAPTVKVMADWNATAALPDWSLGPIHDHVKSTGTSYKTHTAEQLTLAAHAWQAEPTLPFEMATEIGALPPQKRLAAGQAWRDTGPTHQAFQERFAQIAEEGRAAVIGRLTIDQWRSLPVAIDALHGKGLSVEAKGALNSALLEHANDPFKVLTGLKGSHFEAAYQRLKSQLPADSAGTPRGDLYAASNALKLVLTFKGGWENWLQVQKRLGRSEHDATYWLQTVPAAQLEGLGQTLLHNAGRNITQLELVTRRWSEVPPEKKNAPFKDILEHLLTNKYENVADKAFAVEAGAWGMSAHEYKARETRYLASQTVAVPFPVDKVWESGELRGRFIPRNDTRGLFLGQHTNSCQHPDGAARSSAWYGQESPRSGFFVVENKHGEVVAESWAWISDNNGVAFDNVEAKGIGSRTADVKKIYQQAANDLAQDHHIVTLGTSHGDLDLAGWRDAGDRVLKLPSDYSGYTDAHQQVVLSENAKVKPKTIDKEATVRGALNSDMAALEKISKARYPEGWQHVPIDAETRGLVIEEPGKGVVGYALIEPNNRYIADIAVMPDANVHRTLSLIKSVSDLVKQVGGEWSADCRDGTSYRLLKNLEKRGKIKILSDNVTNRMGNEDMHHVVFVAAK